MHGIAPVLFLDVGAVSEAVRDLFSLMRLCACPVFAVTYTFINQTQLGIFSLNSATGSLTVANAINFEAMPRTMTVFFSIQDDGRAPGNVPGTTLTTQASVTVQVVFT